MSEQSGDNTPDIGDIRVGIDQIDRQILELIAERRRLSVDAARSKQEQHQTFRDRAREEALIADRIAQGKYHDLDSGLVNRVWRDIIEDSLLIQQEYLQEGAEGNGRRVTAAFQGIEGAYSQLATRQHFDHEGVDVSYLGCESFADVVDAVEQGRADVGVLPLENTTSGGITEVYDLLMHSQLSIVGEIKFRVRHCLLGIEGSSISSLRTVYCHPQAVAQCSDFLAELTDCEIVYFSDTAGSGKSIKELSDITAGAIASEDAARLYGLKVLQAGIGNRDENFTRFVVGARHPVDVDRQIPTKTSLVVSVGNQPGALMDALAVFRDLGINLVKLESRPMAHNPWEEMFYLDLDGNVADPIVKRALDQLTTHARYFKVLGSYPSDDLPPRGSVLPTSEEAQPQVLETPEPRRSAPKKKMPAPVGYRIGSREHKPADTVVEVKGVEIGGDKLVMIAGPCAVESFEQIMAAAEAVRVGGGNILRGGCFKPRTSPYSFQGLGYEGLEMLVEAGRMHGLPIVTEVVAPEDVNKVAESADILQIGARNMQNFSLLSEVGKSHRPVMLKRGMSSSIDELLQAAEYILSGGNQQVLLCERGIRTFETATRNTLDLSAVPVLRERSHLPVIVDPSHAAGNRDLVAPLAIAAKAIGADAIMVEIHPNPAEALSDGPQSLELDQFAELMIELEIG
ncbi:MAG: bifunctional 3-deoxy-7-phosphoheptulonate synthase/chorismate mutase [Acidimicrobiia bacterium]